MGEGLVLERHSRNDSMEGDGFDPESMGSSHKRDSKHHNIIALIVSLLLMINIVVFLSIFSCSISISISIYIGIHQHPLTADSNLTVYAFSHLSIDFIDLASQFLRSPRSSMSSISVSS